jgi:hypothetical protein
MNLEQAEDMARTMAHDFSTPQNWWSQRFDKNTGNFSMQCTQLPDSFTFQAIVTNAMDKDTGTYLGIPSLKALRQALHAHFSPHIRGGKLVSIISQESVPVRGEPVPEEQTRRRGRPKKEETTVSAVIDV